MGANRISDELFWECGITISYSRCGSVLFLDLTFTLTQKCTKMYRRAISVLPTSEGNLSQAHTSWHFSVSGFSNHPRLQFPRTYISHFLRTRTSTSHSFLLAFVQLFHPLHYLSVISRHRIIESSVWRFSSVDVVISMRDTCEISNCLRNANLCICGWNGDIRCPQYLDLNF